MSNVCASVVSFKNYCIVIYNDCKWKFYCKLVLIKLEGFMCEYIYDDDVECELRKLNSYGVYGILLIYVKKILIFSAFR